MEGKGFPSLFALALSVQQIMGGRFILHRTGPGRSAWAVSEDKESVRI